MNNLSTTGTPPQREGWADSGHTFGRRWSFPIWHRGATRKASSHGGAEIARGKKWQARLWIQRDDVQDPAQEVIFYGQSLHTLRLSARDWLACEQPPWFSNVSPNERLNLARRMQQVVVQRTKAQSGVENYVARKKARPVGGRSSVDKEPVITTQMAQRYPLVFLEPSSGLTPSPEADTTLETPVAVLPEEEAVYWSRTEEDTLRERTGGANGQNRFDWFEDAMVFFIWNDLLPERGPDFREDIFSSDVACYTSVNTIHQEDNELLINDYLNRGWFYNGQMRGKVAPHHATGDGPLIVLLYHREPLAR